MKIQQACTKALSFAVYNVENLHLLPFGKSHVTHEGKRYRQIIQIAQPVLAIDLSKNFACLRGYSQNCSAMSFKLQLPSLIRSSAVS